MPGCVRPDAKDLIIRNIGMSYKYLEQERYTLVFDFESLPSLAHLKEVKTIT